MRKLRIISWTILAAACTLSAYSDKVRVVAVNEDNDHYFKLDASLMNEASLVAYIDKLAGGKVTHFVMCPSGQRPSYGSKAWEPIWTGLDEPGGLSQPDYYTKWARNAKLLYDKGIDPYHVWIRRCRERGISPWLSPRMNDCHGARQKNPFRSTTFWREHDELHCEPGYRGPDGNRATFNFAFDAVQDYTFALVKEQLDRYDIDGYELDFMRFSDYFPRDAAAQSSHHLDRFVRRVKIYTEEKAAERGHPIRLGVRVATTPSAARAKGMDVGRWVREGWVDWVCVSTYYESPDYDTPVAEWREWFGDRADDVTLLAGTDHGVSAAPCSSGGLRPYGSHDGIRRDMEMPFYAGFADVQWGSGVDGIYLFNIPYLAKELEKVVAHGLFPEDLPGQRRAYPVSWREEAWWSGEPDLAQLPRKTDKANELTIRLGSNPTGRVSVLVGVKEAGSFSPEVTLNGFAAASSAPESLKFPTSGTPQNVTVEYFCRRYFFPSEAVHGGAGNIVRIGPTSELKTIMWCEIDLEPVDRIRGDARRRGEQIYSVPDGERIYQGYTVAVNGTPAPVSEVRCSAIPFNRRWPGRQRQIEQTELCGMVRFAFEEKATVSVTANRDFREVKVRPLSRKAAVRREGRMVTFEIDRPGGYSVEFDGYHNNLHVFADAAKEYAMSPKAIVFGPGVHEIGIRTLNSGDMVYLDPGAIVYGGFHASNATDIAILGRGIIDGGHLKEEILFEAKGGGDEDVHNAKRVHTIDLRNCRNVRIDGPTIRDSLLYNIAMWGCEDVEVCNVKIVGQWRFNTDGIDLHNCRRARVLDCFARTFDDTFCFKAHDGYGNCEDCVFERCVAWNDWGKAFEVGVECRADHLRRLAFRDCDCIHAVGWVMDVSNVDYGRVSDVTFDAIRVEADEPMPSTQIQKADDSSFDATVGRDRPTGLFQGVVEFHHEYSKENGGKWSGGGFIDGVTLRNVSVVTDGRKPLVRLRGLDSKHSPEKILFEGLSVNGVSVSDSSGVELKLKNGAHAPEFKQ